MNRPRFWNPWSRYRTWAKANPAQAQIALIAAAGIGLIILMMVITLVVIIRMLV